MTPQQPDIIEQQRWEYLVLKDEPTPEKMNDIGKAGWELISATVALSYDRFFFKRKL